MNTLRPIFSFFGLASLFVLACSGTAEPTDPTSGTGGAISESGGASSGGAGLGTGGTPATGGTAAGGTASGGSAVGGNTGVGGLNTNTGGVDGAGGGGTGGESATGGSDGAGGSAGLVEPIEQVDGSFVYEFGSTRFVIAPTDGARITEFSYDGQNVLVPSTGGDNDWGSTFWTSPQAAWTTDGWPPEDAINLATYSASLVGTTVTLTSAASALGSSTVTITKAVTPNLAVDAIDIVYTITNTGTAAVDVAPWEISRVATAGISFFPLGTEGPTQAPNNNALAFTSNGGLEWFEESSQTYDAATNGGNHKSYADGAEGWLAHASSSGLLFVKTFADIGASATAPDHGEIELYSAGAYVEVENQGSTMSLAGGASLSYAVRWAIRPATAGVAVGAPLGDEARAIAVAVGSP
jgi:hypothetical protein